MFPCFDQNVLQMSYCVNRYRLQFSIMKFGFSSLKCFRKCYERRALRSFVLRVQMEWQNSVSAAPISLLWKPVMFGLLLGRINCGEVLFKTDINFEMQILMTSLFHLSMLQRKNEFLKKFYITLDCESFCLI